MPAEAEAPSHAPDDLLFMQNENYALVDALPYIDTQLGQTEVAQQVKALIDEEMQTFAPRDYLAALHAPELKGLATPEIEKEFARVEAGEKMAGIDLEKYKVEAPKGNAAQDHGAWRKLADSINMQLEYNHLRLVNLELLERWGNKSWVANSSMIKVSERLMESEVASLRATRDEVNKKRKLDQISCGNELRKLAIELDQYSQDNTATVKAVQEMEMEVKRLKQVCMDRGVSLEGILPAEELKAASGAAP